MSELTPNLKLFKYNTETDAKQPFSINDCMNANWDKIDAKCGSGNNLLDFKWSDHLLNDMSWLRADTFSWQDGNTYSLVYNELLSEYNNSASTTITEGSITFKRTPKGYKIALTDQETAIDTKYITDGLAWYYILDTANKRFKLPRTKFGFEGIRTGVGDDIRAGLPNITGTVPDPFGGGNGTWTGAFAKGALNNTVSTSVIDYDGYKITFDASRSSSIYGNSDTVQPPAIQMYLYFYVGNFTESAQAQTAGLNSELLNGKADVSTPSIQAPYLKDTYVNGTSGYRVWSDGYCEQWGQFTGCNTTITITFLKSWKNINYSIMQGERGRAGADPYVNGVFYSNFTTTSVAAVMRNDGTNTYMWHACGYLA